MIVTNLCVCVFETSMQVPMPRPSGKPGFWSLVILDMFGKGFEAGRRSSKVEGWGKWEEWIEDGDGMNWGLI